MENWSKKIFPQLMQQRDEDYVRIIGSKLEEENYDVAIIWTGGGHVQPVMEGLGIPQERAIIISNQDSGKIGGLSATKFEVDKATRAVSLPKSVEEQLVELKKSSEEMSKESFVERLGLQKPDKKPRSFVEAMQAGKYGNIGSKGGAHEL